MTLKSKKKREDIHLLGLGWANVKTNQFSVKSADHHESVTVCTAHQWIVLEGNLNVLMEG